MTKKKKDKKKVKKKILNLIQMNYLTYKKLIRKYLDLIIFDYKNSI